MTELKPPYIETFDGRLIEIGPGRPALLVVGPGRLPARIRLISRGRLVIAFAFHQLMSPELLLPQVVVDEFRREFHGRAAIEFMLNKGNRYPRADVVGTLISNGARSDLYMKEIDIGAGLRTIAFAGDLASPPLARLGAAAWLDASASPQDGVIDLPTVDESLLPQSVPCYRCNPTLVRALLERVRQDATS